jgi:hypothetical protein
MEFYQFGITAIIFIFAGTFLYVWVTTPKQPINRSVIKTTQVSGNVKFGTKSTLSSKRKHRRY